MNNQEIDIGMWLSGASRDELKRALWDLEGQQDGAQAELPDRRGLTDPLCEGGVVLKQEAIREIREQLAAA